MWKVALLLLVALGGFWFGFDRYTGARKKDVALNIYPEKQFPVSEHKSFVIVIYSYNQAQWSERCLRSVFEQEYDHYRIVFIDDHSTDGSLQKAKEFIADNNQEDKVTFLENKIKSGPITSLYRAVETCLDREIILPLDGKDWLSEENVLCKINSAYQNPDVWITLGSTIDYPTYEKKRDLHHSFYAALFKQIPLKDLYDSSDEQSYIIPIKTMSGGRICYIDEPTLFVNCALPRGQRDTALKVKEYEPLSSFPVHEEKCQKTDILIFSYDRPLQLYACLESIQRYMSGYEKLSVLYRASSSNFNKGYSQVKEAFPEVHFICQSSTRPKKDFKPNVLKIVYGSASEYIIFGVDDIIVKDFVDLRTCMNQMEKTGAYGFYLRLGRHIQSCYQFGLNQTLPKSSPLANGIYVWDIKKGEYDWGFANSLDLTLFRKSQIREALTKMKYKNPNSMEFNWASKYNPTEALGLYFEHSKMVNIPMNVVSPTGNPHMNYLSAEELLVKFNEGLKIDIEPLYQVENGSPHFEYIPALVER